MHDCILSGHLGRKKTEQKLLQRFYWLEVRDDIRLWILRCEVCQTTKLPLRKAMAPLGSMTAGAPLDCLSIDILGPLPKTPQGNGYILVVNDSVTKWVEVFAQPDETAPTCARVIVNEVICHFGCPYSLHTDQGGNFESNIFQEICKLMGIPKTRTSRNPRCDGITKRLNSTLLVMIRAYIKGQQHNWDLNLGCLAGAYRATSTENGMELGLFNDDTCPSGHISRPTHFSDILCNSFVFLNNLVIWILWLVGFNVPYLTFIDLSNQVEESSLLQILNDR